MPYKYFSAVFTKNIKPNEKARKILDKGRTFDTQLDI